MNNKKLSADRNGAAKIIEMNVKTKLWSGG
jgi:hypothetical protein